MADTPQEKKAQEDREREQRIKDGEIAKGESAQEVAVHPDCSQLLTRAGGNGGP
jgi:hypothetical protein